MTTNCLHEVNFEFHTPLDALPGLAQMHNVKLDSITQWSRKVISEFKNGDQEVEYVIRGREIDNDGVCRVTEIK